MPSRVLIVDDDPVIQLLLRVNFEMEGFEVATADDGIDGVHQARERHPDLVLLDVVMPRLDGFGALAQLQSDPGTADIPVVLLSAKSQPEDRAAGVDAGAVAYVTKPFDPAQLLNQVRSLIPGRPMD